MKISALVVLGTLSSTALTACVSKPIVTDSKTNVENISAPLVIFPLVGTGADGSLASYDFSNHRLKILAKLSSDISIGDVSDDKDLFLLKDKNESRLTVYSVNQTKIVFQEDFESSGKRIGIVRISKDKKRIVFSWRPKTRPVNDEIILVQILSGVAQILPTVFDREISDLHWSTDGKQVFSATYDREKRETVWVQSNADNLVRSKLTRDPTQVFLPYYSREKTKCGFQLDETLEGSGWPRTVTSIDKIESGKRSPILKFASGLERHPHGSNYRIWNTASCKIALLEIHDTLYVVDLEKSVMAEILSGFRGTADPIPSIVK